MLYSEVMQVRQMELLLVLLFLILLLVFYVIHKFAYAPYQVLKRHGIKGPTPLPFFGNYRDIAKLGMLKFNKQLLQEYGSPVGYYLGPTPYMLVTDLDILKYVLVKEFDAFTNRQSLPNMMFLSQGFPSDLFFSQGATWKKGRQSLSPSFSVSKIKLMVPLVKRSSDTLVEIFGERATTEESFNVHKAYGLFTMETILATAFGRLVNVQRGESDQLTETANEIFRSIQEGASYSRAFAAMILNNFPWIKPLAINTYRKSKAGQLFPVLLNTAIGIVRARRETGQSGRHKDFLQLMIDAIVEEDEKNDPGREENEAKETPTAAAVSRVKLTDKQIVSFSVGFILAGYETTANTLAYTSYLLALNPEIQEKLQTEIDEYFEDKPDTSLYDAAQEIEYLDMVLQETLRLYAPVPFTNRVANRTITLNGMTIPQGTEINIPIYFIHKDPQHWEEPERFNPERFTAEEKAKRPQLCHMPFGFGPRNCVGMRFALLEAKIALIELLRKYTFIRTPDTEVPLEIVVGLSLAPKHGIYLKVAARN